MAVGVSPGAASPSDPKPDAEPGPAFDPASDPVLAAGSAATRGARRPRARRGEGERLREEILAAAGRLIAETGDASALSLRAVAREVGITTTSIYLHFASAADLMLVVRLRYLEEFDRTLAEAADSAGTRPSDRVRAMAHSYVRFGLTHRGRYMTMFAAENLPPDLVPEAVSAGTRSFDLLRVQLAAATSGDEGEAKLVAVHLWTALHGIVMLRTLRDAFPWPDLDAEIDHLCGLLIGPRSEDRRTIVR